MIKHKLIIFSLIVLTLLMLILGPLKPLTRVYEYLSRLEYKQLHKEWDRKKKEANRQAKDLKL